MPSWASRITRHFWATRCGVVPERTNDSSCALAASSTDRAVAVGNMTRLNHGQLMLSIVMWDGTLEQQLQSKLNLPSRTEVAGREARAGDLAEGCTGWGEGEPRVPKIRMIEDVEHLSSELHIQLLGQLGVLYDGKVCIDKTWSGDCVATEAAGMASRPHAGSCECCCELGAGSKPSGRISRHLNWSDHIWTNRETDPGVDRHRGIQRIARLCLEDRAHFPSIDETVPLER